MDLSFAQFTIRQVPSLRSLPLILKLFFPITTLSSSLNPSNSNTLTLPKHSSLITILLRPPILDKWKEVIALVLKHSFGIVISVKIPAKRSRSNEIKLLLDKVYNLRAGASNDDKMRGYVLED